MGLIDEAFRKARRIARALKDHLNPPPVPEQLIAGRLDGITLTLSRCKNQLAMLLKEQRDLQLKVHRNANQITHNLREARLCTVRGEHEEAAEHLRARARHEQVAGTLERQLHDFRNQIERLCDHVRGLEMVVEDARRRRSLLVAQRECFQAHLLMGNNHGGVGELMNTMQAEVMALEEVARLTSGTGHGLPSPAEVELDEEILRRRVDDELGQLKRQLPAEPQPVLDDEVLYITA